MRLWICFKKTLYDSVQVTFYLCSSDLEKETTKFLLQSFPTV